MNFNLIGQQLLQARPQAMPLISPSHQANLAKLGMTAALETLYKHELGSKYTAIENSQILRAFDTVLREGFDRRIKHIGTYWNLPHKVSKIVEVFEWDRIETFELRWAEHGLPEYPHVIPEDIAGLALEHRAGFDYLAIADLEWHKVKLELIEKPDPFLVGWKDGVRYLIPGGQWLKNIL